MNTIASIIVVLSVALAASGNAQEVPNMIIETNQGSIEVELYPDAAPETVANFVGLAEGTKEFTDPNTGEKVTRPFYDGLTFHRVIPGFMIQGGCPLGTGSGDPGYKFKDEINAAGLGLAEQKISPNSPQFQMALQGIQRNVIISRMEAEGFTPDMPQDKAMAIQQKVIGELQSKPREEIEALMGLDKLDMENLTEQSVLELQGYKYDESLTAKAPVKGALCMANSGPNTNGSQFFINVEDTDHLKGRHTVFGQVVAGQNVVEKITAVKRGANDKPEEPVTIISIRKKAD